MHSFRFRLFIGLLVVAILAILLVTLLTGSVINRRFLAYVAGNEDAERQAIATVIEHQIQKEGKESVAPLAGAIGEVIDRPITLTDADGDIVYSTDIVVEEAIFEGVAPREHTDSSADLTLALSEEAGIVRVITTKERITSIPWVPPLLPLAGGSFAAEDAAFLGDTNQQLLVTAVVALLLAGVAALWLSRTYVCPIFALTQAAERLAKGDLSQRVEVNRPDELGRLAMSFNAMAEALEDQERLRRMMVGDVAHELRTPLANVRGYLEAIQDGLVAADEAAIASLHEETLLLNHLVEDLQTLSLAEAGHLRYEIGPFVIRETLETAVRAIQPAADEKGVSITVETADPLPRVLGDTERTGQVLRNLLTNAITFTPVGGQIRVAAGLQGAEAVISVRDSGPGINADHADYIFERFYRADASRERDTGGSGLGLAISKAYLEGQNGRIWLENGRDGGATFTFTLPIQRSFD